LGGRPEPPFTPAARTEVCCVQGDWIPQTGMGQDPILCRTGTENRTLVTLRG
jgi:hypothetical protein